MELGPFHGNGVQFKCRSGFYDRGIINSEVACRVVGVLAQCLALSRNQVADLTGLSKESLKRVMSWLVGGGFVDEYVSGRTPPVYALGCGGADLMAVPYERWETSVLLRLVAANQLWVRLSRVWPDACWDPRGEYPELSRGGLRFLVAAPRLRPGEDVLALRAFNFLDGAKLIVVAASRAQALEVARQVSVPESARFTWDVLLRDRVEFYRLSRGDLVFDRGFAAEKIFEKNFLKPLDTGAGVGVS